MLACDDPVQVLAHADVAEVAADVRRHPFGPETGGVLEAHIRILGREFEDMGVEVAERRREQERRAVEVDHRLHRLLDVERLGHVLFLDDRHARHRLHGGGAFGMGLVVAEVVAGADVDEAHGERRLGTRGQTERGGGADGGGAGEETAAVQIGRGEDHE